jgi:hypothetical protein
MIRNLYIEIALGVVLFLSAVMAIGIWRERAAVNRRRVETARRRAEQELRKAHDRGIGK